VPHHDLSIRVYYEDTDSGGVMYHAQYLAFAERARTEAMRALGAPVSDLLRDHGLGFVLSDLRIAYRRPLRLDDLVTVTTVLRDLGAARARLRQSFCSNGVASAELEVTLACVRVPDHRPARIPARWREVLGRLDDKEPEQFLS
jgi:acyl-CoA thioester hydrolase